MAFSRYFPVRFDKFTRAPEWPGAPAASYATAVDLAALLDRITDDIAPEVGRGAVADYIPALAQVEPHRFGMAVAEVDGSVHGAGGASWALWVAAALVLMAISCAVGVRKPDDR